LNANLEKLLTGTKTPSIVMYCGGGFRSAPRGCAQKLGFRNVSSLIGGFKALAAAGWSNEKEN
jgi:rhodanese-related sulfurtransferase